MPSASITRSLGMAVLFLGSTQLSHAVTVQVVGSFNDQSASSVYFYNRTLNQDDDAVPAQTLPSNAQSTTSSVGYFGWGIDVAESFQNLEIIQSHFWFNGIGSVDGGAAVDPLLGNPFSLGTFTYTNEQTILSGGLVEIDFAMDILVDGISITQGLAPEYRIEIDNTRDGTLNPSDTARLIGLPGDISFFANNTNYLLSFNGFSRDGGATMEDTATLAEGAQTSAEIYATLTAVPLPASVWLFGIGLSALFGFVRRVR